MLGLTVRHYADLGRDRDVVDVLDAAGWDALRIHTTGVYSLPPTLAELVAKARGSPEIVRRAHLINELLDRHGVRTVASYGVGAALIEVLLREERPGRSITLTEYAPATVDRLQDLLDEKVVLHDLLADKPLPADVQLLHRLDGSLSNRQWRKIFRSFSAQRVLMVSSGVIDMPRAWDELKHQRDRRARGIKAGWFRTRGAYERLWRHTHRQERLWLGDVDGWWLEPRTQSSKPTACGSSRSRCPTST